MRRLLQSRASVRAWMDCRWPSNWRRPEPSTPLRRCYWLAWNRGSPCSAGARVICRLASRRCGQPLPGATSYSRSRNSCSSPAWRSLSMGGTGRPLNRWVQAADNLRAALSFLLERDQRPASSHQGQEPAEEAVRLCAALHVCWSQRGHSWEGRAFLEQALAVRSGVAAAVQAQVLSDATDM